MTAMEPPSGYGVPAPAVPPLGGPPVGAGYPAHTQVWYPPPLAVGPPTAPAQPAVWSAARTAVAIAAALIIASLGAVGVSALDNGSGNQGTAGVGGGFNRQFGNGTGRVGNGGVGNGQFGANPFGAGAGVGGTGAGGAVTSAAPVGPGAPVGG